MVVGIYVVFGKCFLYIIFFLYWLCFLRFKIRLVMVLVVVWKWLFNILVDILSYFFNRMGENFVVFGSDWYWLGIIFDFYYLFEIILLRYFIVWIILWGYLVNCYLFILFFWCESGVDEFMIIRWYYDVWLRGYLICR